MELLDLELLRVAHGGYCVARHGGKVVFVRGGLPGERVRARLAQDGARHAVADVVDVLLASPDRVPHVWQEAAAAGVGGASLGHVAPAAQLRWKAEVIADVVRRIGGARVAAEVGPVEVRSLGVYDRGTRTRVRFVVDDAGRLAMRRPRSHGTVALHRMPLAVPALGDLHLFGGGWSFVPGEEVAAVVPSDSPPVVLASGGTWSAPGEGASRRIRERVVLGGRELRWVLDAAGFWQVHRDAPRVLAEQVVREAAPARGQSVLELYSGAGLLTVPLADAVGPRGRVVAVEASPTAVADATGALEGRPQARVRVGRVDARAVGRGAVDVVVLDPPRSGAGTAVMGAIMARSPARIVYVACDPAALARDLAPALDAYTVGAVTALDLFPHTHHVELVVRLDRRA